MGEVKDKVVVSGRIGSKQVEALFDSGATYSQIEEELAKEIGVMMLNQKVQQVTADKRLVLNDLGFAMLNIKGCLIPTLFAVLPKATYKVTVGLKIMQLHGVKLDLEKESYEITCPVPSL